MRVGVMRWQRDDELSSVVGDTVADLGCETVDFRLDLVPVHPSLKRKRHGPEHDPEEHRNGLPESTQPAGRQSNHQHQGQAYGEDRVIAVRVLPVYADYSGQQVRQQSESDQKQDHPYHIRGEEAQQGFEGTGEADSDQHRATDQQTALDDLNSLCGQRQKG